MKCRHCNAELTLQMIDLGAAPLSNAFLSDENQPEQHYPLRVLVCEQCWLAQTDISLFKLDHDQLFTKDYPYYSSTSPSFVVHAEKYVADMFSRFGLTEHSNVVEIGSNDGYLLQFVKSRRYGIEPTDTGIKAREKGIPSFQVFFTEKYAEAIRFACVGQLADLLVCNNVLAHVPDINDFVRGCAMLLSTDGVATFEFPHLLNIIQQSQFDTIYHEHYSYLSLTAVKTIFKANGLHVFDVEELPTHGGSLRVYADLGKRPEKLAVNVMLHKEATAGMKTAEFYTGLQAAADRIKNNLMYFLLEAKAAKWTVAGFGAAAKGNTLLNYAGVRGDLLAYVVDDTPAKHGKFLPGSRIPVRAEFEGNPRFILVLPWNFWEEINDKLLDYRDQGVTLVRAVPRVEFSENTEVQRLRA